MLQTRVLLAGTCEFYHTEISEKLLISVEFNYYVVEKQREAFGPEFEISKSHLHMEEMRTSQMGPKLTSLRQISQVLICTGSHYHHTAQHDQ